MVVVPLPCERERERGRVRPTAALKCRFYEGMRVLPLLLVLRVADAVGAQAILK